MNIRIRWLAAPLIMTVLVVVIPAVPASAVVLVNTPPATVCVGKTFQVGVFYQTISGGWRGYRVGVKNPQGKLILWKTGRAPSNHWLMWTIHPHLIGTYKTTYWYHKVLRYWTPFRVTTKSHRC